MSTTSPRLATAACAIALAGLTGACTAAPTTPPTTAPATPSAVSVLADLAQRRLATADVVAAAKWRNRGSIADAAREQVVIDTARAGAVARGLDAERVAAVFRDQIEANKVVQYGLFSAWSAAPDRAPTSAPDLTAVRPELDRLTPAILDALATTRAARAGATCPQSRDGAAGAPALDDLHRRGLARALASVCG